MGDDVFENVHRRVGRLGVVVRVVEDFSVGLGPVVLISEKALEIADEIIGLDILRLLDPDRLEELLETILGRREEQSERRRVHIAELNRRAAESELRLKRLYDAIEAGVADLDDPALKERIAGLKVIRDQSRVDADRAQAMLESTGERVITPEMVGRLSQAARERMRLDGGGDRRDHLRALAQRVEVGDDEVRIMGSKSDLLRTLVAAQGGKSAAIGVPARVLKWRRGRDSVSDSIDLVIFHKFTLHSKFMTHSMIECVISI